MTNKPIDVNLFEKYVTGESSAETGITVADTSPNDRPAGSSQTADPDANDASRAESLPDVERLRDDERPPSEEDLLGDGVLLDADGARALCTKSLLWLSSSVELGDIAVNLNVPFKFFLIFLSLKGTSILFAKCIKSGSAAICCVLALFAV